MYTRRVVAMLALGAISCSDAAAPPLSSTDIVRDEVAASSPIRAERGVVRLEAYIDGRSSLQLGTPTLNTIRWFHHEYAAPGRLLGARLPTRFDDKDWYPNWPDLPDSENRDCQCSSYLEQHQLPLWPARYAVNVEVVRSRGTTTV